MDYRVLLKEENEAVKERAQLAAERVREIASGKNEKVEGELGKYFKTVAAFLEKCDAIMRQCPTEFWTDALWKICRGRTEVL